MSEELSPEVTESQNSNDRKPTCLLVDSLPSNSTDGVPNRTKRQRTFPVERAVGKKIKNNDENHQICPIIEKPFQEQNKLENQDELSKILLNFCMNLHPENFLFKGLKKGPVCHVCFGLGSLIKCGGTCGVYFHKKCLSESIPSYNAIMKQKKSNNYESKDPICNIEENLEQIRCAICTMPRARECFVCSSPDGDCIQCSYKNCGKSYHLECLKNWPQYKTQYSILNKIKNFNCSRHVCHTCVSIDIETMRYKTESDKKLIKCMLCPATYHRSSECIPAGSELLSETQMICVRRHQANTNLKGVHTDYCVLCSGMGTLICCEDCPHAVHQNCLGIPVGDKFYCEVI